MNELLESAQDALQAGRWDEALTFYEAALSRVTNRGDAADVAEILRRIGSLQRARGEIELAGELFEASRTVAELNGLDRLVASAMLGNASVEQWRGDLDGSERTYVAARDLAREAGDLRTVAMAEQNLGILATIRGDLTGALVRYDLALTHHRSLGDDRNAAFTLNNMGMAQVDLGDLEAADRSFQDAFDLADRCRDTRAVGAVALNRAELLLKRRNFVAAREACDFAVGIFDGIGAAPGLAEAHKFYGILYRETAKTHLAEVHFGQAIELARRCEDVLLEGEVESERAVLYWTTGQNQQALHSLNRAHRLLARLQARRDVADLDRRLDALEATFLRTMQSWAETVESKDRYTAGHCDRVAEYACRLAEAIGVTGRELHWFRMGAVLHDVGKLSVPESILNKPGKLDPEEWQVMQNHTVQGDEIVSGLDFPWDIRPIVRSHHEHWAGTGYPDRLSGAEIPLHARILCIADVYDALTSARSYKAAYPHGEAIRIMERDSGRIFDPELFSVFLEVMDPAVALSSAR